MLIAPSFGLPSSLGQYTPLHRRGSAVILAALTRIDRYHKRNRLNIANFIGCTYSHSVHLVWRRDPLEVVDLHGDY